MSAKRPMEVRAMALGREVRRPLNGIGSTLSWQDERPHRWIALRRIQRRAEAVIVQGALAGLVLAAFVADACAPWGAAMWLLHAIPLALCHLTSRVKQPRALAAASTVLILAAWFLSPHDFSWPVEAFNRGVFACVLWLAAAWVVRSRRAEEARQQSEARERQLNDTLEQRVRERTARLESAKQELDAFAYSVSHDLRAPLRAVDGFARILEEEHASQLDVQGRRTLAVVRAEAGRMGRLIDDLLDFSRRARQEIRPSETDMTALVREAFDQVKGRTADREVEFQLGELPAARGDAALLRQVWVNLLDNALKYTRHRPRAQVWISGTRQGAENLYSIRDNGAGFDMKYAGKLFGVFQRLHRSEEFEGAGVGLALVQRIIRRHGGRVGAQAQVERGATFYFTLPSMETAEKGVEDGK